MRHNGEYLRLLRGGGEGWRVRVGGTRSCGGGAGVRVERAAVPVFVAVANDVRFLQGPVGTKFSLATVPIVYNATGSS